MCAVREHFAAEELVNLTLAVVASNGWNRLNVAFRTDAWSYQVGTESDKPGRRLSAA